MPATTIRPSITLAPLYFVPDDTLVGVEAARQLGIHDERDLFGGIVPYPFVATKTITHPLVDRGAQAPDGWQHDLGERLQDAVLYGFTAFSRDDARRAGMLVLQRGAARVKPSRGIGGRGQVVVSTAAELDKVIEGLNEWELSHYGVVVEQNFENIVTYSVGQVRVGELLATYYGTQNLTKDNNAAMVYGGSALIVSRGDYDALFELDIAPNMRCVIDKARAYEAAVAQAFPEWLASRRNYDVAEVIDSECRRQLRRARTVVAHRWRKPGRDRRATCISSRSGTARRARNVSRNLWHGRGAAPGGGAFPGCRSNVSVRLLNTPWFKTMKVRDESIDITVDGEIICGTLFMPPDAVGAVLFAHGWGGSQQQYLRRACAVAELGYLCLTFDFRGHGRRSDQLETVSRADNLRDLHRRVRCARRPAWLGFARHRHRRQQLWRLSRRDYDGAPCGRLAGAESPCAL